jgi:hypothetical protein
LFTYSQDRENRASRIKELNHLSRPLVAKCTIFVVLQREACATIVAYMTE